VNTAREPEPEFHLSFEFHTQTRPFTDELVADSDAVVDAVMTDDEAVDESKNRRQVARHTGITAQLVHQ